MGWGTRRGASLGEQGAPGGPLSPGQAGVQRAESGPWEGWPCRCSASLSLCFLPRPGSPRCQALPSPCCSVCSLRSALPCSPRVRPVEDRWAGWVLGIPPSHPESSPTPSVGVAQEEGGPAELRPLAVSPPAAGLGQVLGAGAVGSGHLGQACNPSVCCGFRPGPLLGLTFAWGSGVRLGPSDTPASLDEAVGSRGWRLT